MPDALSPPPRYPAGWCPKHRRPRGPDGTCPLCAGPEAPTRGEHVVVLVIASAALIAGAGLVGYLWQHKDDPGEPPPPEAAPARPAPRKARPAPDAEVAVVLEDDEPPVRAGHERRDRTGERRRPRARPRFAPRWGIASRPAPRKAAAARPRAAARVSPGDAEGTVVVRPVSITMYMTRWCPHCTRARRWLQSQRIPYREVNVENSPTAAAELRRLNPRGGVPTFNIDGRVMVGFSPAALATAIRMARERRANGP